MSLKRARLGSVFSLEARAQVTTENSSHCTQQPSAPPQKGFVSLLMLRVDLATKPSLCILHCVGS